MFLFYTHMGVNMGFDITNEYQKQRFSLSEYAVSIIKSDLMRFEFNKRGNNENLGGFLNILLFNLYDHPIVSEYPLYRKIESIIDGYFSDIVKEHTISALNKKRFVTALSKRLSPELSTERYKDTANSTTENLIFRVDNSNMRILKTLTESDYFDDKLSKYLNYLFETYSRQSTFVREQLVNRSVYEALLDAIKLKVHCSIEIRDGSTLEIAPYEIYIDPNSSLNYVLAIQEPNHTPVRLRLCNIRHVRVQRMKNRIDHDKCYRAIEDMHQPKVKRPFLVELNRFGEIQLMNQIEGRPKYEKVSDGVYRFNSYEEEILYYFLKFGPNATILEPLETRIKFKKIFELSLKNY